MNNALKLIAIGLALSYDDRKKKVEALNDLIDITQDTLRSASIDGQPHGSGGVSDSVSNAIVRVERIEQERDREQERLNAVDWAFKYVQDIYSDDDSEALRRAINLYLNKKQDEALRLIATDTNITPTGFHRSRGLFLKQVLVFLKMENNVV